MECFAFILRARRKGATRGHAASTGVCFWAYILTLTLPAFFLLGRSDQIEFWVWPAHSASKQEAATLLTQVFQVSHCLFFLGFATEVPS